MSDADAGIDAAIDSERREDFGAGRDTNPQYRWRKAVEPERV